MSTKKVTIERDGLRFRVGVRRPDGSYDPEYEVRSGLPLVGAEETALAYSGNLTGDVADSVLEVDYRFLDEPRPEGAEA